jgi:hypothetical protein
LFFLLLLLFFCFLLFFVCFLMLPNCARKQNRLFCLTINDTFLRQKQRTKKLCQLEFCMSSVLGICLIINCSPTIPKLHKI